MIALLATLAHAGNVQLETFDHVVQRIPAVQPDGWDASGWDAAAQGLRKRAKKAKSADDLRPVLSELLGSLGESHYAVLPRSWSPDSDDPMIRAGLGSEGGGTAGLAFAAIDGELVIRRVTAESPAHTAGLEPGDVVTALDGEPIAPITEALFAHQKPAAADLMLRMLARSRVDGVVGQTASLTLGDGREIEVGRMAKGVFRSAPLGHMPGQTSVWTESSVPLGESGVSARYVAFEVFVLPVVKHFTASIEAAIEQDAAFVLDLRGNPGGVLGVGQGVAGFLVSEPISLGKTRAAFGTLDLVVNPRPSRQRFTGPVAVLVDRGSASTSEILAAGLKEAGRARVFGSRTAGMALPSHFESLPNGDALQLATGDYQTPGGTRIEGRGLEPDVEVDVTRDALKNGHDPVLDAALQWLASELSEEAP